MAVLEVHSTAIDIAAMYDGIRQAAIDLHGREGECRTLGQLMADVAADVIVHGIAVAAPEMADPAYPMERIGTLKAPHRKAVQATVLVVVPAETATGAENAPAELAGMGAIDAEPHDTWLHTRRPGLASRSTPSMTRSSASIRMTGTSRPG